MAELVTGRPLFPALDENELLEFFTLIIGRVPHHMIHNAKKKHKFFHRDNHTIIPSSKSRLVYSDRTSFPLTEALAELNDPEFVNFLQCCLILDPDIRYSPEQAMRHQWLQSPENPRVGPYTTRNNIESLAAGFIRFFQKEDDQ